MSVQAVHDVYAGRRPMVIVESLKAGDRRYELAVGLAEAFSIPHRCTLTFGIEGDILGETVFIAQTEAMIDEAIQLVHSGVQHAAFPLNRNHIAGRLGIMLGYPADDVYAFIDSEVHQRCACSLCGGPHRCRRAAIDQQTRRTMYHT